MNQHLILAIECVKIHLTNLPERDETRRCGCRQPIYQLGFDRIRHISCAAASNRVTGLSMCMEH